MACKAYNPFWEIFMGALYHKVYLVNRHSGVANAVPFFASKKISISGEIRKALLRLRKIWLQLFATQGKLLTQHQSMRSTCRVMLSGPPRSLARWTRERHAPSGE